MSGSGWTVGQLAKRHNLSRSTLLYYDRLGLLRPSRRSYGNYRLYTPADLERLEQICLYRQMGVPLKEIATLIAPEAAANAPARILRRRLTVLDQQIRAMQDQQRRIVRLLAQMQASPESDTRPRRAPGPGGDPLDIFHKEHEMVSKQRWVEIMAAAGFSDEDMRNWHRQFEKLEPDAHQEFLESLNIPDEEIEKIRAWSRQ